MFVEGVLASTLARGKFLRETLDDETRRVQAREACLKADGAIFDILMVTQDIKSNVTDGMEMEVMVRKRKRVVVFVKFGKFSHRINSPFG